MIIFAGWGIMAAVLPAIGYGIGYAAGGSAHLWTAGIGLILGGVATYYLGAYVNITRPARDLATAMDARAAQLHAMADAGTFYRGPGYAPPSSVEEAHQQANDLAVEEYASVKDRVRNRHTLFWIPMQYVGLAAGVGGVVLLIVGLVR